jgi:molecular chaperone GrpE
MSEKKHKPNAEENAAPETAAEEPHPEQEQQPDPADAQAEAAQPESGDESPWAAGELEALRAENAELKDRLIRLQAEMENLRKRTERDKADTAKYAISEFARDVLSIGDNISRAIEHVPAEAAEKDSTLKTFRDGIEVTERELLKAMERHGITRIDPKGERFDPNLHQAMFEVPNPDVPEGTVTEVVQPGYMIADRVLRPAMVGVAKGGEKPPKPQPSGEAETPPAANDDAPGEDAAAEEGEPDGGGLGGQVDRSA